MVTVLLIVVGLLALLVALLFAALVEMYRAQVKEDATRYHKGAVFIVLDART